MIPDLSLPAALAIVACVAVALWLIAETVETWWVSRCPWVIEPDFTEQGYIWTKKP